MSYRSNRHETKAFLVQRDVMSGSLVVNDGENHRIAIWKCFFDFVVFIESLSVRALLQYSLARTITIRLYYNAQTDIPPLGQID